MMVRFSRRRREEGGGINSGPALVWHGGATYRIFVFFVTKECYALPSQKCGVWGQNWVKHLEFRCFSGYKDYSGPS